MGFAYTPLEAKEIWHGLPQNLDILITHTPPFNIRDQTINNIAVGCK
jgi:Icc-related predicted phosphoesterase